VQQPTAWHRAGPEVQAVERRWSRLGLAANDTQVAQFHDIVAWETVAESAAESLPKSVAVAVEGRLQTRTWEAADGSPRRATEIVAGDPGVHGLP